MSKKQTVATRDENTGALALPHDYGKDAGRGQEELGITSGPPPFIRVLQSGSPQVKKQGSDYVPGAEEGMFFNTATSEFWKEIVFVPIGVRHVVDEWIPKDNGGGFIAEHAPDSDFVAQVIEANKKKTGKRFIPKPKTENGHELVETFYCLGFVLDAPGGNVIAMGWMPFTSIKIKPYRSGIDALLSFAKGCPIFAHQVRISSVWEERPSGDSFNVKIVPALGEEGQELRDQRIASLIAPDTELYELAKAARTQFEGGEFEVQRADGGADDVPNDAEASAAGVF